MLKLEEFKYYKRQVDKDIKEHDTQMDEINAPEKVIAAYSGKFGQMGYGKGDTDNIIENYLFIAANTILPSLFFQLPRVIIRANREALDFEAAVLDSVVNIYLDEQRKQENQDCIIDAFLPYGYAVMKNGYNSRTMKVKGKKNFFTGTVGSNADNDMEGDVEYISYETPLTVRQSPKDTFLDSTQPFGKGNRITFRYVRTLQEIIDSNLYKLSSNFISHFKGQSAHNDAREVNLTLFEHWTLKDGRAWKLVYVEGWDEELFWGKTEYDELPVSYLRFNNMSDQLYPISHGTLAYYAQRELNYLNELWKKHLDNLRNQHLVDFNALDESGKKTLMANEIGGIVGTTRPVTQGVAQALQSAGMDPNLFNNIQFVRDYLNLVLSTTGVKAGGESQKTATAQRQQEMGDVLRSSGMQDMIRDFLVDQVKQLIKNLLKFGSPEMIVKLTGENLVNPNTGMQIKPGTELQIGGDEGYKLQDLITGDVNVDYIFDVDITSAQRPDFPVVRKQLIEGMTTAMQLMPILQQQGIQVNFGDMLKDYYATFDAVPNSGKYITDMSEQQKAMLQQQMMMQQMAEGGGQPGVKAGVPQEAQIAQGAGQIETGTEGFTGATEGGGF